jgi:hypothetical protein
LASLILWGGGGTFKSWGLVGGLWVIGNVPLKRIMGPGSLLLLSHGIILDVLLGHVSSAAGFPGPERFTVSVSSA